MMDELQIYCGIDTRDGKLTGSSCRTDDPNYLEWAMIEMATKDVRIEKMGKRWALCSLLKR